MFENNSAERWEAAYIELQEKYLHLHKHSEEKIAKLLCENAELKETSRMVSEAMDLILAKLDKNNNTPTIPLDQGASLEAEGR